MYITKSADELRKKRNVDLPHMLPQSLVLCSKEKIIASIIKIIMHFKDVLLCNRL